MEIDANHDAHTDAENGAENETQIDAEIDANHDGHTNAENGVENDTQIDAEIDANHDGHTNAENGVENDTENDTESPGSSDSREPAPRGSPKRSNYLFCIECLGIAIDKWKGDTVLNIPCVLNEFSGQCEECLFIFGVELPWVCHTVSQNPWNMSINFK